MGRKRSLGKNMSVTTNDGVHAWGGFFVSIAGRICAGSFTSADNVVSRCAEDAGSTVCEGLYDS